jgi:dTDP-4-dehydrorhamnose 3,5-epimerase
MVRSKIITGGTHTDARGTLTFFNDFDMKRIRRFYQIEHPDNTIIRAWQGHQIEQKWFYVVDGSFKVVLVQPDNWKNPSVNLVFTEFILKSGDNNILHIPGGMANGFQAMEPHSKLIIFSNFSIKEVGTDDIRFDKSMWYQW